MKYIFTIIIGLFCWDLFDTHQFNEVSVQKTITKQIRDNGYDVEVSGVNLPITFTFLSSKVGGEVFFEKDNRYGSIRFDVTSIGSYPIMSIFDDLNYQTYIRKMELMKLSSFK